MYTSTEVLNMQNLTVSNSNVNSNSSVIGKEWNEEILVSGGLSFFKDEDTGKVYRVSMTSKTNKIVFKWRIKTASGGMFSISAKTNTEAQKLVNILYGKNKYTVSMMLL